MEAGFMASKEVTCLYWVLGYLNNFYNHVLILWLHCMLCSLQTTCLRNGDETLYCSGNSIGTFPLSPHIRSSTMTSECSLILPNGLRSAQRFRNAFTYYSNSLLKGFPRITLPKCSMNIVMPMILCSSKPFSVVWLFMSGRVAFLTTSFVLAFGFTFVSLIWGLETDSVLFLRHFPPLHVIDLLFSGEANIAMIRWRSLTASQFQFITTT